MSVLNALQSAAVRRAMLSSGGVQGLLDLLRNSDGVCQEAAASALMGLTASEEEGCTQLIQNRGIPVRYSVNQISCRLVILTVAEGHAVKAFLL